jgi:hypothetical protein
MSSPNMGSVTVDHATVILHEWLIGYLRLGTGKAAGFDFSAPTGTAMKQALPEPDTEGASVSAPMHAQVVVMLSSGASPKEKVLCNRKVAHGTWVGNSNGK